MTTLTVEDLKAIVPRGKPSILKAMVDVVNSRGPAFGVETPREVCHFVAQCAHESAGFRTTVEYASGEAYEGRKDLGNTKRGDGKRFKGRGVIQLTGRANYRQAGNELGLPLETNPRIAAQPETSVLIALWYWHSRRLSRYANKDNIRMITKRINGGYNGLADRKRYFRKLWAFYGEPKRVSTTNIAAAGLGGSGVMAAVSTAAEVSGAAKETYENLGPIILAVVIACVGIGALAWYIIHERNKKRELYLA